MPGVVVRGLVGALLALVAAVLLAPTAFAHDDLVSSTPAAGSTVTTPPREVSLTFSAAIGQQFAQVAVVDSEGRAYQSGTPVVRGDTVVQAVDGLPAAAALSANYRVVSSDGHPISGSVPFTVTAAVEPSATAETAEPEPTTPATAPATQDPVAGTPESVTATADATPVAVRPPAQDGAGSATPIWLIAGVAALALGGLALWLTRRRGPTPPVSPP